ncbi:response regulator [Melittangium boletus]|uniref:Chemotaxis protein CheY n=1 Tax=Melittangium boletus DSM 14713 TaxID=1294270 RepID=A0A250IFG9_9BACT|nr:response regulator [Melittangium boletus]ATB30008.1 chemotaxis protein CheY [Melittangium boletus DSM 14713]
MSASAAPILLVEDDQDIRETVCELLEMEGYPTVTSNNGQEALAQLHRMARPCLILLDVMMPVMDGHTFMARMRAEELLADIPVVVTSASHRPPAGASAYVPKPIDVDELMTIVKRHCR